MAAVEFKKSDLLDVIEDECETLEKVRDRITDNGRWSIRHELVFKEKESGRFFATGYSVGATEQQDESPFEHEPDSIACDEVWPTEKVVIVYARTPPAVASAP